MGSAVCAPAFVADTKAATTNNCFRLWPTHSDDLFMSKSPLLGGYTGLQQVGAVFYAGKPVSIVATGIPPGSKQLASCTRIPDARIRQLIQGE